MSGGKPHILSCLGRENPVFRSAWLSSCQVGCLGAVGLRPLTTEEHLAALSFSAWFVGWAQYLPASEDTWQAWQVVGSPLVKQGMTPQALWDQHLHLHLQQTSARRRSTQARTGKMQHCAEAATETSIVPLRGSNCQSYSCTHGQDGMLHAHCV